MCFVPCGNTGPHVYHRINEQQGFGLELLFGAIALLILWKVGPDSMLSSEEDEARLLEDALTVTKAQGVQMKRCLVGEISSFTS